MFGRVDEIDGEYAAVEFAYIAWMPVVPEQSWWLGAGDFNHRTRPSWRGIAGVYARWWGTLLAAILIPLHVWVGLVFAALALLGFAAKFRWRHLPADKRREAAFNRAAFGTACDPDRRTVQGKARLRVLLEAAHESRLPRRPVEDVASHGATDPDEAVIAYGLLRLEGRRDEAMRIVDGKLDPGASAGPYRIAAEKEGVRAKDGDGLLGLNEDRLEARVLAAMEAEGRPWGRAPIRTGFPTRELLFVLAMNTLGALFILGTMVSVLHPHPHSHHDRDNLPFQVVTMLGAIFGMGYSWVWWGKLVMKRRAKTLSNA